LVCFANEVGAVPTIATNFFIRKESAEAKNLKVFIKKLEGTREKSVYIQYD